MKYIEFSIIRFKIIDISTVDKSTKVRSYLNITIFSN